MKKYILTLFVVTGIFTGSVLAQTDKGTTLLGGDVTFQTSDGTSLFTASPNVGLFIMNDVAVTAAFNWFSAKNTSSWALGPGIRLYLFGNERGKFISQVGFNIGGAKGSDTDLGVDLAAGWAFFIYDHTALEMIAKFRKTGDKKAIFTIGAGFQIHSYN